MAFFVDFDRISPFFRPESSLTTCLKIIYSFHTQGDHMSQSSAPFFVLPFNQSIRIKSDSRNPTTSDAGTFLLRLMIDRTGILDFLTERLHDPRDPQRTQYPLFEYTVATSVDAGMEFLVDGCGQPGCGLWCVHQHQSDSCLIRCGCGRI